MKFETTVSQAPVRAAYLVMLMFQIAWIVLFSYFLHYFNQLKDADCACALGWRTTVLRGVLAAMILLLLAKLFLRGRYTRALGMVQAALIVAFIVVTYQFSKKTRETECKCAQTSAFRVLDVVNIIMLFLLALTILSQVLNAVFLYMYARKIVKRGRA